LALLFIFALAVYTTSQRHLQIELQNAVDAADLAAATALVDDYLLTTYPDRWPAVLQRAREKAQLYADRNRVAGLPFRLEGLDKDCRNCPEDELVFGRLQYPSDKLFDLAQVDVYGANAVRIAVKRRGVTATSTAYVDRDVIGFKPQGGKPLPVIPLAVLTDPQRVDKRSWDHQILDRHGTFRWFVDPHTGRPRRIEEAKRSRDDDIPEMTVVLSTTGINDNGRAAVCGINSTNDLKRQIRDGIAREDLLPMGGQLLLDGPSTKLINQRVLPRFKHLTGEDLKRIAEALQHLVSTGERRIWLLYSRVDVDSLKGHGTDYGSMLVQGFVSAQVMHVEIQGTDAGPGRLLITLQPSMKITATAVTDASRRHLGPRTIHNPYICKVRIVD
jgi:hypothetical protein